MSKHRTLPFSLLVLSALSLPAFSDDVRPTVFTALQAQRGKIEVESSCGLCHLQTLRGRVGAEDELPDVDALPASFRKFLGSGAGYVPPLAGEEFIEKWKGKPIQELAEKLGGAMKSFPPAGMDDTSALAITAYVVQLNGASAGDKELTSSTAADVGAVVGMHKVAAAR